MSWDIPIGMVIGAAIVIAYNWIDGRRAMAEYDRFLEEEDASLAVNLDSKPSKSPGKVNY